MNAKERESDLWRARPALHRALPLPLGSDRPPTPKMIVPRSTKSTVVHVVEYDKPHPWRYVRWRRANERQSHPIEKEQDERPKGNYVYKVLPGEDLGDIAIKHDTFVEVIMEANKILSPHNVANGQLLWIPQTHFIKRGNTLWSLSRKYGVSIASIQKANGIEDPNLIFAGSSMLERYVLSSCYMALD